MAKTRNLDVEVYDPVTGEYLDFGTVQVTNSELNKRYRNGKVRPMQEMNEYGYTLDDWANMNDSTREVVYVLAKYDYNTAAERQRVLNYYSIVNDNFGYEFIPKNSRKYKCITKDEESLKAFESWLPTIDREEVLSGKFETPDMQYQTKISKKMHAQQKQKIV